jgi:hypothetical protein
MAKLKGVGRRVPRHPLQTLMTRLLAGTSRRAPRPSLAAPAEPHRRGSIIRRCSPISPPTPCHDRDAAGSWSPGTIGGHNTVETGPNAGKNDSSRQRRSEKAACLQAVCWQLEPLTFCRAKHRSSDEVRLVNHATELSRADADEDALVSQSRSGAAERMSPSAVPSGRTICQSALAPGSSFPLISGPVNAPPVSGTMRRCPLGDVAEIERLPKRGLQAVDLGETRTGNLITHRGVQAVRWSLPGLPGRWDAARAA